MKGYYVFIYVLSSFTYTTWLRGLLRTTVFFTDYFLKIYCLRGLLQKQEMGIILGLNKIIISYRNLIFYKYVKCFFTIKVTLIYYTCSQTWINLMKYVMIKKNINYFCIAENFTSVFWLQNKFCYEYRNSKGDFVHKVTVTIQYLLNSIYYLFDTR